MTAAHESSRARLTRAALLAGGFWAVIGAVLGFALGTAGIAWGAPIGFVLGFVMGRDLAAAVIHKPLFTIIVRTGCVTLAVAAACMIAWPRLGPTSLVGFVIDCLLLVVVPTSVFVVGFFAFARRQPDIWFGDDVVCAECGYAVAGLTDMICPECGLDLLEPPPWCPKCRYETAGIRKPRCPECGHWIASIVRR